MNTLLRLILAGVCTFLTSLPVALAADEGPPAQQQKNQVPDSTQNGNYLEPQQDNNNGNAANATQERAHPSKQSKPGSNMEKKQTLSPETRRGRHRSESKIAGDRQCSSAA